MATAREVLALLIKADASGAVKELERVGTTAERQMGRSSAATDMWGKRLQAGGAAAVGFAALAGRALYGTAQAAAEAEHAELRLDNTLANAPRLAGANRQAFLDLAKAVEHSTAVDDEAVIGAEALLGQYGATAGQIITLIPLVADLSQKMGVDMDTAAKAVGKSIAGNTGALRRMGIDVDKTAAQTDAFGATQDALSHSVKGAAEAIGRTMSGRLARLKNELKDVEESVGAGVIPVIENLVRPVQAASDAFGRMPPAAQKAAGTVAAVGTAAVGTLGAVSMLTGTVMRMHDRFTTATTVAGATTTSLNAVGKTAIGVGTAVAIASTAFAIMSEEAAHNAAAINEVTDALMSNSDGWRDSKNTSSLFTQSLKDQLGAYRDAKLAGDANAESIKAQIHAASDFPGVTDAIIAAIDKRTEALSSSQVVTEQARKAQQEFADALASGNEAEAAKQRAILVAATAKQSGIQAQVNAAIDEGTAATDGLTDATGKAADAVQTFAEKTQALYDGVFSTMDAEVALQESHLALADAQDTLSEAEQANRDAGSRDPEKLRDLAKAQDGVKSALIDSAEKAAEYAVSTAKVTDEADRARLKSQLERDELRKLADGLAPGSSLRVWLQGYIDQLNAIPTSRATIVSLSGPGVVTPGGQGVHFTGGGNVYGRGGIVRAKPGGQVVTVAESGSDEVILPLDDRRRALDLLRESGLLAGPSAVSGPVREGIPAGQSSGPVVTIERMYAWDAREASRALRDELDWLAQTSGRV